MEMEGTRMVLCKVAYEAHTQVGKVVNTTSGSRSIVAAALLGQKQAASSQ